MYSIHKGEYNTPKTEQITLFSKVLECPDRYLEARECSERNRVLCYLIFEDMGQKRYRQRQVILLHS